ncbi:TRAP transporter large permease subunit [Paracoccus sp. (in: a-proteobacteria)]|uniref:TRAP transporter large permease subunit n=1 Tax=Paracoccus sp. TaxID=267 RepID=UPI003A85A578
MTSTTEINDAGRLAQRVAYWMALALVLIGMVNAMPGIPGLDALAKAIAGDQSLKIRRFSYQYFFPLMFTLMMLIVVLTNSMWVAWRDRSPGWARFGLFMDVALVAITLIVVATYMNENPAVCLVDHISGTRAALIEQALQIERENAALFGLPEPTSVDNPDCVASVGGWLIAIMAAAVAVFLAYNIKVWGLPLVMVAIIISAYTGITVLLWYFFGADDMSKYLVTKLGGEPRLLADGYPRLLDALISTSSGLFGQFLDIILNDIFPYLVLGSLFGASAGGQSLIKLAFRWTRKLNGGPAHAAIVSSAMFGTISGGPITNVLSTGVLTIPMMIKRGFSKVFAGGIEAAASSGGSIMPPVMGVAAFVLAAMTVTPYSQVIIAAILPAIAYFFCLFLSVVFQARKQKITAIGELTPEMHIDRQDKLNLLMIFGPILLILILLLSKKEGVGCGWLGGVFGAERVFSADGLCRAQSLSWLQQAFRNAAGDVGSAGWWAVALLLVLLFLDPQVRARPRRIVDCLSEAGVTMSTLYLMFLAVSIIDFCLKLTGLPFYISVDVLNWLNSLGLGQEGSIVMQLVALTATMGLAVVLGMGMPAVPAYINVALLMGPVLSGLGVSLFTANMFIFYFAVASAITPPVAIAAFAAASIARSEPMATGFSAVKSGIVIFLIPFVFAIYPELLLITPAIVDPSSGPGQVSYLPGYDGNLHPGALAWLILRIVAALYLISSVLAGFDRRKLAAWELAVRMALAILLLFKATAISGGAFVLAIGVILLHRQMVSRPQAA